MICAFSIQKMHNRDNKCISDEHVINSERNHYSIALFCTFLTCYMHGYILGVFNSFRKHQQVWTLANINLEKGDTCDGV